MIVILLSGGVLEGGSECTVRLKENELYHGLSKIDEGGEGEEDTATIVIPTNLPDNDFNVVIKLHTEQIVIGCLVSGQFEAS